ncbi:S9 family peptidase [Thermocrispum municipale]|uniref:S9 family peptidase n=1 Tax=Thermocrispum municipale TaxID=37926 RepID=UPI00041C699A|nr:prolyl oligopeptidase family serine peptidase [Thermocrispum municipale]
MQYPTPEVPDRLFDDDAAESRWRARFTAPRMSAPDWAQDAPSANLYVSNASGVWEVYAWDRDRDEHRKVTDRPNGTMHADIAPDGSAIWWFDDTDGDEFGRWMRQPFTSGPGAAEVAVEDVHAGYPAGLVIGHRLVGVGVSTDDGSKLFVHADGHTRAVYESEHDAGISALSRDEKLLAISHSEHGDSRHPALRVLALADDSTVGELWDGPGRGLEALEFSPVAGDQRLLVQHERRGHEELLVWDVRTDEQTELRIDLPGEITGTWYPDGQALLILQHHQARSTLHTYRLDTLHTYRLDTGELTPLPTPAGVIGSAGVRPDGSIEYSWSSAAHPSVVRRRLPDGTDDVLLAPPGPRAPGSVPVVDAFVEGPAGTIHALVARPEGATGPLPTVFAIHGGPHAADTDRFSAYRAVWVDAGFAVVEVNYRGSDGYGSQWRDAIEGRPGLTELEDIAAVHDWAVASGLADPQRCVVNGASWGGYLTLLALGVQPERWAVGIAGVPVADYVTAYADEMEPLRAFDRSLFGGSPDELPELYRECSPITYVDAVRAPVLVLAGDNDPRCPIRQIENYLDRLAERNADFAFYRYDAGHGSLVVAEVIRQTAIEVFFALRKLNLR